MDGNKLRMHILDNQKTLKSEIIEVYLECIKLTSCAPTYVELLNLGVNRNQIRDQFGNLTNLHQFIKLNHSDQVDNLIAHEDLIFNQKRLQGLSEQFKDTKVFIVTTAVAHKQVDQNLYASIKQYLQRRNGRLIVVASDDVASRNRSSWGLTVDNILKDEFFVAQEFRLNSNLFISDIKVSAKQILPTTGLSRIGQTNGSYIFASPKQMLEFVATSPQEKHPKAIMTTGAITKADYSQDRWMSQRTSYIATHDHVMGGIIVEIVDDKFFHFRHFQANHDGEFVDLGNRYFPDGSVEKVTTHLYSGDWHSGSVDPQARIATEKLCKQVAVENFFVGDFFDGYAISHHHINQPLKRTIKSINNTDDLVAELRAGGQDANDILKWITGDLVMIRGNHDEVLEKYLNSGNYNKDFRNQYVALGLAQAMIRGENVISKAYQLYGDITDFERIVWLDRDDQFKIAHVECGQHGDLGSNGTKGSLLSLEKAYGNCIVGHAHSGAIMRGVFRVGTMTLLSLEYNKGPSSWTHTSCLVYEDGSRQLINMINGEMCAAYK